MSDCTELGSVELKFPGTLGGSVPTDAHWQRKLENAQNVIFCKEVFAQVRGVSIMSSLWWINRNIPVVNTEQGYVVLMRDHCTHKIEIVCYSRHPRCQVLCGDYLCHKWTVQVKKGKKNCWKYSTIDLSLLFYNVRSTI